MTSKFFQKQEVSSSESEEGSELSSEKQVEKTKKTRQYDIDSSSEDEDRRVIKTEKEKRFDDLQNTVNQIQQKIRIKDFVSIQEKFETLNKQVEKAKNIISKEGVPGFYIEVLINIENLTEDLQAKLNLSTTQNKSFNILRQKIKKHNKQYEKDIEEYKKKEVEKGWLDKSETATLSSGSQDSSDDFDDESGSDSDTESVVSDNDPQIRRLRWLKPEFHPNYKQNLQKKVSSDDIEKTDTDKRVQAEQSKKTYENVGWTENVIKLDLNLTEKGIYEEIKKILEKRQLNSNLYFENVEILRQCLELAKSQNQKLEVLLVLLPVRYDYARSISSALIPRKQWNQIFDNVKLFFEIIKSSEIVDVQSFNEADPYYQKNNLQDILVNQLIQLNSELQKSFKQFDQVCEDYIYRLQDLQKLLNLLNEAGQIISKNNFIEIGLIRMENLYFLSDSVVKSIYNQDISGIFQIIYENQQNPKIKTRTLLYQIYNHALHDRLSKAKDLLLLFCSLIKNQIIFIESQEHAMDTQMEVLFNRAIAQMGLSAFRQGLIFDCQNLLQDICHLMKIKENLCQIINKNAVEKTERLKFVPLHQHINSESVEAAFMISSMLYEMPNICSERQSSKFFKKMLESYDRNYFVTIENNRDYVYQASQELDKGNWQGCFDHLEKVNIWKSFNNDQVKQRIKVKTQESALICFLVKFKNCFQILSVEQLVNQFQLSEQRIRVIICQLFQNQLQGYFDQEQNICLETSQTSKLQELIQELQSKVNTIILHNERIMDGKFGNYGFGDKGDKEIIDQNKKILKKKQVFVQSRQLRLKKK